MPDSVFCAVATRDDWLELLIEARDQYERMADDLGDYWNE